MKRLIILATRYSNTSEAQEIFQRRDWKLMRDDSTIPKIKRVVDKGKHSTTLIDLDWEEIEYGKK